jgi:O-antigen ligase
LIVLIALQAHWGWDAFPSSLMVATGLAALLPAALLDPTLVFAAYLAILVFRPWELWEEDRVLKALPRLGAAWSILSWGLDWIRHRHLRLLPASLGLLVFFFWTLLSTLMTPSPGESFAAGLGLLIPSLVLFLLAQFWTRSRGDHELLIDAVAIAISVATFLSLILGVSSDGETRLEGQGIFANSNDLAALCVLALPLALRSWLTPSGGWFQRFSSIILSLPLFFAIEQAQSRGAWLGVSVVLGSAFSLRDGRLRLRSWIFAAILVIGASVLFSHRQNNDLEQSTSSRLSYWLAGLNMALHNPILCVGLGQYPEQFETYSGDHQYEFGRRTAHSAWILALAETGIPGLFIFLGLFLFALRETWRFRREFGAIFLSLLGYAITITFLSHTFLFYPYLMLGLAFGVIRLTREPHETSA